MRRLRHLGILLRDLAQFSGSVGAIWLLPIVLVVLVTAGMVVSAHSVLPYVVYTFF